ncbi:MAG TPA: PASTA domain-containing protein [Kofleriaceae bacterium]|nr:PASTA domain-containing protein [Kofleriaceae bacterium]
MSKAASVVLGAIVIVVAGGAYAYQELGWFKAKPKPPEEPEYKKVKPPSDEEVARKSEHIVPDLTDLDEADARKAVVKAGFMADALIVKNAPCKYASDKDMKPIGSICLQQPPPGTRVTGHTKIEVAIEADTYEHGAVGFSNEWRRMPDVVGETKASALQILADKGFGPDEFEIDPRTSCAKGTVCGTRPEAGLRKVKSQKGVLSIAQ